MYVCTCHRDIYIPYVEKFGGGKYWQIIIYSPTFSSSILTDMTKLYLEHLLTLLYLPTFSLPITFICMIYQKFLPTKVFSCTVHNYIMIYLE